MKRILCVLSPTARSIACSSAGGILGGTTPGLSPTGVAATPTFTPAVTSSTILPTALPASSVPVAPVIGVDTVPSRSPFISFAGGELVRSLAFSPDGRLVSTGGVESIHLWRVVP